MSTSYIKINFNIDTLSSSITYSKNIKRVCWFCEKKCYDFVSICDFCKYEKFPKNKKK
jgi:hypothetical protein